MKYFGFRASVIKQFESYLSTRKCLVCVDVFSQAGTLKYGVPQGSILGPLLFLLYVKLFLLYVNNLPKHYQNLAPICMQMTLVFSTNIKTTLKKVENVLNKGFLSLCQWLIDSKLSIHFGEDKTKSILFSKARPSRKINISFADHSIKQHETVEYLGC